MKFKITTLFSVFILIFLVCCKKTPNEATPSLNSDKEITEFKLEATLNPVLTETIVGVIEGSEITLSIPEQISATQLIATFVYKGVDIRVGAVQQESAKTVNDFSGLLTYVVSAEDGTTKSYQVNVNWLSEVKSAVPHIFIDTDGGAPINSKDNYVDGSIRIDGGGLYDNYEGRLRIKGRGNSTWDYPKKPYRLKLDNKAPLLGLDTEKDWILLANYLDGSLMCNAVAFKIARLLEMPFTNHVIPVDVTINGTYVGNYMFTEQKEVEDNRVNVGEGGLWLELDTYFDEQYKFYSKNYQLPVMVHYPELEDLSVDDANAKLNEIKNDFNVFDDAVKDGAFPDNNYLNYFDGDAFVDYMIVYTLSANEEINHPKSTYIYKKKGGKFTMGPVWDFDWGFGYQSGSGHFTNPDRPLFWGDNSKGNIFFSRLMQDPAIRSKFKTRWAAFKSTNYSKLINYIEEYASVIKDSYARDFAVWARGSGNIDTDKQKLLSWLDGRVNYIDNYCSGW